MRLIQCHLDEPRWDGESCPPCRGSGRLVVGEYGICPPAVVACPWCGGDGFSGRRRAELAALERMWEREGG